MHLTDHLLTCNSTNISITKAPSAHKLNCIFHSCDECAARLSTLQDLFAEMESLPELALTQIPRRAVHSQPEPASPTSSLAPADSDSASRHRIGRAHHRRAVCNSTFARCGIAIIE